jgi:DNA-binding CsgD family transcriptional regulator
VQSRRLTSREAEVCSLAAAGLTNESIASRLNISTRTVEAHMRSVLHKMGVSRRADLMRLEGPLARTDHSDEPYEQRIHLLEQQLESYEDAMRRLVDRQFPLFDERVNIAITIGENPSEDAVTERHWTDPNPYLVYRVVRPISATDNVESDVIDSLDITCEVDGADVGVTVATIRDRDNRPQALILFQPGLARPAEWVLRYRTPGLWDPLRNDGVDKLAWAAGTLDRRYVDGINALQVDFDFPSNAENVHVSERRGGTFEQRGDNNVRYVDASRTGGRFEWQLRMKLEGQE